MHYLAREAIPISRERVRNLMRRIILLAIYQKPRTSFQAFLLCVRFTCLVNLYKITSIGQVWLKGITCIPLRKGFLYLL